MALRVVPMELGEANAYVEKYHSHHGKVVGHKFSIGVAEGSHVAGVVIIGRPVARMMNDGWTLEVTRCCTNGHKNAASMLYAAAWRATKAMGYKKLITYTLIDETGTSLIAAGYECEGEKGGGSWHRPNRPRVDKHPLQQKIRWVKKDAG